MEKHSKTFLLEKKKYLVLISVIALLLATVIGYFLYNSFLSSRVSKYLIENKYYGFKLQTPKDWTVMEKTVYSEDKIAQLLEECKANKTTNEIGVFRFESLRYPEDLASLGVITNDSHEFSTGAILELSINCSPNNIKAGINDDLRFGSATYKNLQYIVTKNIYISPADKINESKIKENFSKVFDNIIASFKFVK